MASGDVVKRFRYLVGIVIMLPCLVAALLCALVGIVFEGANGLSAKIVGPFRRAVERTWSSNGLLVVPGSEVVCWVGYAWEKATVIALSSGAEESKRDVFWVLTATTGKLLDFSARAEGSTWFYVACPPVPWTSPEVGARVVAQNMKRELKVVCRDKADGCLAIFENDPAIKVRLCRDDETTGRWFRVVRPLTETRA